jgi:hypothetical protein
MRSHGPLALIALILTGLGVFAFQNLSPLESGPGPMRNIAPMAMSSLQSDIPVVTAKPSFTCAPSARSVIYLRLPSHFVSGTHVVGAIDDTIEGHHLPVDFTVGQTQPLGACQLNDPSPDGLLKICLPGQGGSYLVLSFVVGPEARRFEWSMPVTPYCENDLNWQPAIVQSEAGGI